MKIETNPENHWPAVWDHLRARVKRLCGLFGDDRLPDSSTLHAAIEETWLRLGWSPIQAPYRTWADCVVAVALIVQMPLPGDLAPRDTYHRGLAAAALLGWIDAPWALTEDPWSGGVPDALRLPVMHKALRVPAPEGW